MLGRRQQTIEHVAKLKGFGLFTNEDVTVQFHPAAEHYGIVFERIDLPGSPKIPAKIDYLAPEERRTKLVNGTASVEMTEHVLAALAGLQIDNCLIQIDAPELPGCDGSALPYVETLLDAHIVSQSAARETLIIPETFTLEHNQSVQTIETNWQDLRISYDLDFGNNSPIGSQLADFTVSPDRFATKIAFARTFVLEQEIEYLRSQGYGKKVTFSDLLVYGENGLIGNTLRAPNECARHKLLDCLGDIALCGFDVHGHIRCFRSGHAQNHILARKLNEMKTKQQKTINKAA